MVTATALNIRVGPSSQNKKVPGVAPAELGSVLRVYARQNGWLKVSNSNDEWVSGRYTDPVTPALVNTDGTNVRSGPSTSHTIVNVLDTGERVFVVRTKGKWSEIEDSSWIHSSLLDV
ncbi:MAG: SH3 domain-containing protein [Pseudomonadota bacterium]